MFKNVFMCIYKYKQVQIYIFKKLFRGVILRSTFFLLLAAFTKTCVNIWQVGRGKGSTWDFGYTHSGRGIFPWCSFRVPWTDILWESKISVEQNSSLLFGVLICLFSGLLIPPVMDHSPGNPDILLERNNPSNDKGNNRVRKTFILPQPHQFNFL